MQLGEILFTFDDGPSDKTLKILDVLENSSIKGIFFFIGKNIHPQHSILLSELVSRGHRVENHTHSHKMLTKLNATDILAEIELVDTFLYQNGITTKLVRPPFGEYNQLVKAVIESIGKQLFLWNIDSEDWKDVNGWDGKVLSSIGFDKKNIILMHDTHRFDINKLQSIIQKTKNEYNFAALQKIIKFY